MYEHDAVPASRWKRLGGAIIDALVSVVVMLPVMAFTGYIERAMSGIKPTLGQTSAYFLAGMTIFLVIHGYLLYTRGQTVGKYALKTRIIGMDGEHPSLVRLFVLRYVVVGAVTQFPIVGPALAIVNVLFIFGKERRCLHDHLANTRVIDIEATGHVPVPPSAGYQG